MANSHLWFNSTCLRKHVIPNYINLSTKSKSPSASTTINKAKILWLKTEVRKWYQVRDNLNLHQKLVHCRLASLLHPVEFDSVDSKIREEIAALQHRTFLKQQKKLRQLMEASTISPTDASNQNCNPVAFYPRVVNLSSVCFSPIEDKLLSKGLAYVPPPNPSKNLLPLTIDLEYALSEQDPTTKSFIAHKLKKFLTTSIPPTNNEDLIIRSIKSKIARENLIVTKADKGNSLAILGKTEYINKVIQFIDDSESIRLKNDPTQKFQRNLNKTLKNCPITIPPNSKARFLNMNPSAPILYGLLKLHKPNIPIRPVASFIQAPTYKICKLLNSLLPKKLNFQPRYTVKNSSDLVSKISGIPVPPNAVLVSFDIVNLFPSVPILELKSILNKLLHKHVPSPLERSELSHLLNISLDQNYFRFNNSFYSQKSGLPMGSPLSPLLADIFLDELENKIFSTSKFKSNVQFWYRYVDDVVCLWTGSARQLDMFLSEINTLNTSIKFTMEIEANKTLNFLDISIDHKTDKFCFNIFRKPTFTDTVIPADSSHSYSTKCSSFNSMICRLLSIPLSPKNFNQELHTIYSIAQNNGYTISFVDSLLKKMTRSLIHKSLYTPYNTTPENNQYRRILYIPNISPRISRLLKPLNIIPAPYSLNSIRSNILNNKIEDIDILERSGVYKIKCGDCFQIYVGQSGRSLKTRLQEHLDFKRPSHVADHMLRYNHHTNIDNVEILHLSQKGKRLDLLEAFEIKLNSLKAPLINQQINILDSPLLDIPLNLSQ
jgi:Reverse transcriptase (RNA-dependent DNA polymerase)